MSLPIMRRVTCSRSGRRRCAWTWVLQRSVIHDTIKLLNGDAGSGAFRLDHCGFGCRCQLCSQDTTMRLLRRLRHCPGRLLCRESGCSPRKALPGPRSSVPSTSSSSCRSLPLRVYHRRSGRHMQAGKTQDSCIYSSLFSVNASGRARLLRAGLCCGVVLRRRAGGPRGVHNLCKTHAVILRIFLWVFDL